MKTTKADIDSDWNSAVQQGDERRIRLLMKKGTKPPKRLMLYALLQKHPELLPILKEAGSDPNDEDGFHNTALGCAVNRYTVEVVKTLLEIGADPNKESTHLLPLVYVAYDHKIDYVKALLNGGADPNHPQQNGVIPLYTAARRGQGQVLKLLLEFGGDPKIKGPDGLSAIDLAASAKRHDLVDLMVKSDFQSARGKPQTKKKKRLPKGKRSTT